MTLNKLLVGALGSALCGPAVAAEWNLQPAALALAADIHWVHEMVMLLVLVLFAGVFGVMFYSCYAHRKSIGRQAGQFHGNTTVEILWTMIPAVILVLIAWPVAKVVIAQNDSSRPDLAIKATEDETRTHTLAELKARGEKVYAEHCVACHQANGRGMPPAFPPLDGSQVVLGAMGAQINVLLNGRPKTAMESFGRLNDLELAAVITFTRNSWGNKTGAAVQPADVKVRRNPI